MLCACAAASCCLPQEATKVEPKHYKLAFENDSVQVVDVPYGPHEKCATFPEESLSTSAADISGSPTRMEPPER